jgi:hypothetical protein
MWVERIYLGEEAEEMVADTTICAKMQRLATMAKAKKLRGRAKDDEVTIP